MPPPRRKTAPAQPLTSVVNLAFLPHLCDLLGVRGLTDVTADLFRPPIGFLTPNGVVKDTRLQQIVDARVLGNRSLATLRFALVDLTDPDPPGISKTDVTNIHGTLRQPAVVGVAGKDETKQGGLASMAKLACMWAAFQLRFDIQSLEKQVRTNSEEKLFDQGGACRKLWDIRQIPNPGDVKILHQANPKIELHGSLVMMDGQRSAPSKVIPIPVRPIEGGKGFDYPDLFRTFNVTPGTAGVASLDFIGSDLIPVQPPGSQSVQQSPGVQSYLRQPSLEKARKLTFWERMFLMIDASDDPASHTCVQNVGWLYIASLLWQTDLFSPGRNGGLWEGDTHLPASEGGKHWIKAPVPKGDSGNDFITGTAASVAAFLTALAQNRLVSKDACDGMKFLTDITRTGRVLSSFFFDGLNNQHITVDRFFAKVGVGNLPPPSRQTADDDCALIERKVGGKKIRYVAAGFDATGADALHRLIVQLDKCIQQYNGLIGPGDP